MLHLKDSSPVLEVGISLPSMTYAYTTQKANQLQSS